MVSSRGEQGAVRPAVAAGAAGSLIFFFTLALAGSIGGAWGARGLSDQPTFF